MKRVITFLLLSLIFSGLLYGQEEIPISSGSTKYVEPYLAVNPVNGDILAVYFSSPQPGNLFWRILAKS